MNHIDCLYINTALFFSYRVSFHDGEALPCGIKGNPSVTFTPTANSSLLTVHSSSASGWQSFSYGKLGELTENIRTFAPPFENQTYTFNMNFEYDSWNRIKRLTYPDGEVVSYDYNLGGMLKRMYGNKNSVTYRYVDSICYNKYELRDSVAYGNDTRVIYEYDSLLRLSHLRSWDANGDTMQSITYKYDSVGNITNIINTASMLLNGLGGTYRQEYTYDNLYRLTHATGWWECRPDHLTLRDTVDMRYSKNGRIIRKRTSAETLKNMQLNLVRYDRQYQYPSPYSNKLGSVTGVMPGANHQFGWDGCGNMVRHDNPEQGCDRRLSWTEDNRLQFVKDNGSTGAYYQYDAGGDRTYKLLYHKTTGSLNGVQTDYYTIDDATLYVSPYLVITPQGYTKHYYAESERITTQLGKYRFTIVDSCVAGDSLALIKLQDAARAFPTDSFPTPTPTLGYLHSLTDHPNTVSTLYFYHPDHLGSASWITNIHGKTIQHLYYLPWGEDFVNQRSSHFDGVRYTFSAKEKDTETGYSYFGARYYSSDLSIWLSVDPKSDKYPSVSPYVYCANNPVRLVDPNGEEISTHTDKDGNVLAVYNDGILGIFVHTQAEIDDYHNGVKFQNNYDQMIGYSLCVSSFAPGDKIDFGSYQAKQWLNIFEGSFCTSFTNPLHAMAFYASEAGNGGIFDPKSKFSNGSQLSEGIYVSPRDLGNFAAGYFGRSVGLSKETTLASFGAFQLAKNNKKEFIANFHNLYKQALSTQGQGIEPPQKTYGEAAISNYFQRLGYENIRTMSDFEKKYEQIWKD